MKKKLRLMMTMLLLAVMGSTWGQTNTTATDVLNRLVTGVTSTSYVTWTYEFNSGAVYSGNSAGGNSSIQLRASSNSGIVCKESPGKVKKITIEWNTNTVVGRVLDVYGKNTAYSEPSDLYGSENKGTKLGSMTYSGVNTVLTINGDYSYIGLRSSSGAMYLSTITIEWEVNGTPQPVTYTVTYDANGGSGTAPEDNGTYTSGDEVTVLDANGLTKDHYTFGGWNTAADGSGAFYDAEDIFTISKSIILYAQWNPNTNTVTLPQEDTYGTYSMDKTSPVAYGENVELTYTPATGYEDYVATWSVNGEEINGNSFEMPDEPVTVTVSLKEVTLESWIIDFENATTTYSNWTFSSISSNENPNSECTAHGGSKIGKIGATSGYIQTNDKIAKPVSLTCYVSKQSNNSVTSTWSIQVSSDGSEWINVANISGGSMNKGEWKELTANLSSYSDVYVRVYYTGSNAIRLIDDLTLTFDKASVPTHELSFYSNGELISTETKGEGEIITFPSNPADEGDYVFVGWTTTEIDGVTDERPEILNTSSTPMAKNDMIIYAVFANLSGEGAKWKRVESKNVGAGVYAIVNSHSDKPFNGSLSNGDAQLTTDAFIFESDGYAYNTPDGTCELTISQSGSGYSMYNADYGYLDVKEKAGRGHIAWQESENSYWSYSSNNWGYLVTDLAEPATSVLQCYDGSDIRNYAATTTYSPVYFAQKEATQAYSNYCTLVGNYENVDLKNDGYRTYVTQYKIDWAQTLDRNQEKNLDVHGYRISQFSKATVTLTELSGITEAGTPIVLKGKMGQNCLVIADENTEATETATNLLQAGPVDGTLTEATSLIYVLQKTPDWTVGTTYEQYKFYPLKFTRWKDIRSDQAYLVLQKESEGIGSNDANDPGMSGGPNPSSIGMRFIHAYDDEPMVSDDAGLVDRINDIQRNATLDGEFYSISGVRIAAPTKGLYIVNGKKVLVK